MKMNIEETSCGWGEPGNFWNHHRKCKYLFRSNDDNDRWQRYFKTKLDYPSPQTNEVEEKGICSLSAAENFAPFFKTEARDFSYDTISNIVDWASISFVWIDVSLHITN